MGGPAVRRALKARKKAPASPKKATRPSKKATKKVTKAAKKVTKAAKKVKQGSLTGSFISTAKRRAFAAVDRRKTPMSDGATKVTFGGWGIKDGLTHRYEARAAIRPTGITIHWSNKSAKGKTAATALDAAAKKGLLPNRSDAAKWREARKAAGRAVGAKKNPSKSKPKKAKKSASKPRKNPATGLSRQTAQQAVIDLKQRGYQNVTMKRSRGIDQVEFTAWTKAQPCRQARLIVAYTQPDMGSGDIAVTLGALVGADWAIVGSQKVSSSQAVSLAGSMASRQFSARKPASRGKTSRKAGVLAGMFANPAEEDKAWKVVQKVFRRERAQMRKSFPDIYYTGLRPDPKVHDTERHYAMTSQSPNGEVWISVAPALGLLPTSKIVGVIRHELGHAAVFHGYEPMVRGKTARLSQYDRVERQADRVAEKLSGHKIYYDAQNIEVSGPGARGKRPRPAGVR